MQWRVPFGMATAAGLVLGWTWAPMLPAWGAWIGSGLGILAATLTHGHRRWDPLVVCLLAASAGALRFEPPATVPARDDVWVMGRVTEWRQTDRGTRARIRPLRVAGVRVRGRGELLVFGDGPATPRSRWIGLRGRIEPDRGATNPGGWSDSRLIGRVFPDRGLPIQWGPGGPGPLADVREIIRERSRDRLGGFAGRLTEAILLGRGHVLLPDERDLFRRNGASHLVAVSGLHVGLVTLLVGALLAGTGRGRRHLGIPLVAWVYVGLAGAAPSALRAAAMITAWRLGRWAGRHRSGWAWLAAVTPWILWMDPSLCQRLGFRLSVAAVLGIVFAMDLLGRGSGRWRRVLAVPLVSLGAQAGTLSFAIAAFGTLSPLATLPNLVAVPLTGLFLPAAVLSLACGGIWIEAARVLAGAVGWVLMLGASVLPFLDGLPLPPPGAVWLTPSLMVLWFGFPAAFRANPRARGIAGIGLVLALMVTLVPHPPTPGPWAMFLDVGQGDAAALRLSDGSVWLVDVGDDRGGDDARWAVLPFLRHERIRRVQGLILSHRHRDHVGGLETLLEGVDVERVFDAGYGASTGTSGRVDRLLHSAERWPALAALGDTLHVSPTSRIVVLHPPRGDPRDRPPGGNLNEASLMLRIDDGPVSLLFAADGEHLAEAACLRSGLELGATVLKVGHHGSDTSSGKPFIDAVQPQWAVISCGTGNRYGHPDPGTVVLLRSTGARLHRTDTGGGIRFRWNENGLRPPVTYPPRASRNQDRRVGDPLPPRRPS